jgi:hypothetical protein
MRQVIHIFRKDARHLYREILLVWTMAVIFGWIGTDWGGFLLRTGHF